MLRHHDNGALQPAPNSADYDTYIEWLHYSEGSAMLPLMLHLYTTRLGDAATPLRPRIDSEIANHLSYVNQSLNGKDYFVGGKLTGADIQMSFVGEMAKIFGTDRHLSESEELAGAHARPARFQALDRERRRVQVRCLVRVWSEGAEVPSSVRSRGRRFDATGCICDNSSSG